MFYLYGFTLNRITLFALIFSIGILVDDAIVVIENIVRHFHLPHNRGRHWSAIAVDAVGEVGNPTILATFAVIAAVLPMAFVGGLMGPYMRPIPIGSSAAMFFSLAIAFIVTPWASIRILRWGRKYSCLTEGAVCLAEGEPVRKPTRQPEENFFTRLYRRFMGPLIAHPRRCYVFLAGVTGLLLAAMALVGIGWVKVKMLPFDNKSEFQIILNMPEGSSLERTTQAAREIAAAVRDRTGGHRLRDLCGRRPRRSISTASCAITSCGAARTSPTSKSTLCRKANARPRATTSPSGFARASRRSPRNTARAWPSPKSRPARQCCRPSWPKFMGRTEKAGWRWRTRSSIFSTTRRGSWTRTGISKPTSRRCASSWTRRRRH